MVLRAHRLHRDCWNALVGLWRETGVGVVMVCHATSRTAALAMLPTGVNARVDAVYQSGMAAACRWLHGNPGSVKPRSGVEEALCQTVTAEVHGDLGAVDLPPVGAVFGLSRVLRANYSRTSVLGRSSADPIADQLSPPARASLITCHRLPVSAATRRRLASKARAGVMRACS